MKIASEVSIVMMPQSAPGVPAVIVCGGYNVQPAPVGPPKPGIYASNSTMTETR